MCVESSFNEAQMDYMICPHQCALFSKMRQFRALVLRFPAANRLWPQWTATFRVSAIDTNPQRNKEKRIHRFDVAALFLFLHYLFVFGFSMTLFRICNLQPVDCPTREPDKSFDNGIVMIENTIFVFIQLNKMENLHNQFHEKQYTVVNVCVCSSPTQNCYISWAMFTFYLHFNENSRRSFMPKRISSEEWWLWFRDAWSGGTRKNANGQLFNRILMKGTWEVKSIGFFYRRSYQVEKFWSRWLQKFKNA